MMKAECAKAEQTLLAAVQGRLSGNLLEDLQAHLEECPACRTTFRGMLALQSLVADCVEAMPGAPEQLWNCLQGETSSLDQVALLHSILKLLEAMGVPKWGISPMINALALAREANTNRLRVRLFSLAIAGLS